MVPPSILEATRSSYLNINESQLSSKQELVQAYVPKLRLARVYGFEGVKNINRQLNQKRRKHMGKLYTEIKLEEYFLEEIEHRMKDQSDLVLELCKAELSKDNTLPLAGAGQLTVPASQQNSGGSTYRYGSPSAASQQAAERQAPGRFWAFQNSLQAVSSSAQTSNQGRF